MNRRQYLASFSVVGTAALAGCLDGVSGLRDSGGTGPQREPTVEMTRSYREADRDRRRAVGELNRIAISLAPVTAELEGAEDASIDADALLERIADARDHLESAAATDDATAADVEELSAYADVLAGVIETAAVVTDDALPDALETLSEEINDRRLEEAETTVSGVRDRFEAARASLDPALYALEELDRDRLDDLAVVDLERIEEGARLLDDVVTGLSELGAALDRIVTGHQDLERGEEHVEEERYSDAAAAFDGAAASYGEATARSTDAMDAPGAVRTYAETTHCQSTRLETAAEAFADSARAADELDPVTARQREEDGQEALADAEACS